MGKPTERSATEKVSIRVGRFIRSARPDLTDLDRALAEEWLSDGLLALFASQSEADQRHAVTVSRLLLRAGCASRDLLAAALLHDVGKRGATFTPWHRTAIALLESWAPGLLGWLARWETVGLLAPFAVHRRHADLGAELAGQAGASPRTVALIRQHHQPDHAADEEVQMLHWADDHA